MCDRRINSWKLKSRAALQKWKLLIFHTALLFAEYPHLVWSRATLTCATLCVLLCQASGFQTKCAHAEKISVWDTLAKYSEHCLPGRDQYKAVFGRLFKVAVCIWAAADLQTKCAHVEKSSLGGRTPNISMSDLLIILKIIREGQQSLISDDRSTGWMLKNGKGNSKCFQLHWLLIKEVTVALKALRQEKDVATSCSTTCSS